MTISGIDTIINSNKLFQYPVKEKFQLEELEGIVINYQIIEPKEIIFKHYFHSIGSFDILNQKELNADQITDLTPIDDNIIWGELYPSYLNNKKQNIYDCSFVKGE